MRDRRRTAALALCLGFCAFLLTAQTYPGAYAGCANVVSPVSPSLHNGYAVTPTAMALSVLAPAGAVIAELIVEVGGIRYRDDGTAPTAAQGGGTLISAPSNVTVCGAAIGKFQMISTTGGTSFVSANFYQQP